MDNGERVTEYFERSFLAPLLSKSGVTDISFNGEEIFYVSSHYGRKRSGIEVDNDQVGSFLRQIANMTEQQFSYITPRLDVSFSRYRLNATFFSIGRVYERKVFTFSVRIAHDGSAVSEDSSFFPGKTRKLLLDALSHNESIVIAGETGAGKTELQKYLLMNLPPYTRVIAIDNIGELERIRGEGLIDLTFWLVDEKVRDATFSELIRNGLRNNPDYLLVAEVRGREMFDALGAVMSGHPIITTLHAKDLAAIPYRMARMAQAGDINLQFDDLLGDIYHHFSLLVYVGKSMREGAVYRRIVTVGRLNEQTREIEILYEEKKRGRPAK